MKPRRILVTGASGLIGRQTISPLKDLGFTVVALSRSGKRVAGADEQIKADLLDYGEVKAAIRQAAVTHLMHLAWHDNIDDRWTSLANIDWSAATLQLVRAFAEEGGTSAVISGSCAEYDWSTIGPLSEDSKLGPSTLYGAAKAAAGGLLMSAAPQLGLNLAWARVFFCYGPGEPPGRLVGDLISGLSAGKAVDCTDGRQERDFLHTADVGRALATLAAKDADGPVNIGSGNAVPVVSVIEKVARLVGRPDLVRLGVRTHPDHGPGRVEAVVTRLTEEFGFKPRFDMDMGLADTVRRNIGDD